MYLSSISSKLCLYDTNSWDLKKCYGCYDGILRDISWSDDSKYLLQVNCKGVVEILSAADHDVRSLQHIPIKDSWSAAFHRDGHRNVAIGTKNGNVMIWDTKNKNITKTFPPPSHQCNVNFISYNAKNTSLAATMQSGDTIIYGLVSNIPVLTVKVPCSKCISSMKFHHEARSILGLATDEGHVLLRDVTTNKDKVFFEKIHAAPVSDIAFSLINRDVMLSAGYDKVMNVYDTRLQNVVSAVKTQYFLTSLTINYDNQVALGTKNGLVLVYDLRDVEYPLKVLKGHDEEVHKVSFQPVKRKLQSAELSLREDAETNMSPIKVTSPVRNRASDMFILSETPPKGDAHNASQGHDTRADSFLVMVGLDKSNEMDDNNRFSDERKSDMKYRQPDTQRNIKISTPLANKTVENFGTPSMMLNGIPDEGQGSNPNIPKQTSSNQNCMPVTDAKVLEELKEHIKFTCADVADDNRNYFLHIMMALTKQKLYLEKELSNMSEQLETIVRINNELMETTQKLTLEVNQLKRQAYF